MKFAVDLNRALDVFVDMEKAGALHRLGLRQSSRLKASFAGQFDFALVVVVGVVFVFDELVNRVRRPLVRFDLLLLFFGRERADDKRRARFVDQNGVRLVDKAEIRLLPLRRLLVLLALLVEHRAENIGLTFANPAEQQPVAEEVEPELLRRAVGYVALVRFAPVVRRLLRLDYADLHPERVVNRPHEFRVARREVVVDRREERPFSGERPEIHRRGRRQRFSFARLHLDDRTVEHRDSAENLNVEMAHPDRARPRLADERERLGQEFCKRLAATRAIAQRKTELPQLDVGKLLELRLQRVDAIQFIRPFRKPPRRRKRQNDVASSLYSRRYRAQD